MWPGIYQQKYADITIFADEKANATNRDVTCDPHGSNENTASDRSPVIINRVDIQLNKYNKKSILTQVPQLHRL